MVTVGSGQHGQRWVGRHARAGRQQGFPPDREKAAKIMALADRLAPFTQNPSGPGGRLIEFRGRGQNVATEADKRAVASLVNC